MARRPRSEWSLYGCPMRATRHTATSSRTATGRHPADVLRLALGTLILAWAGFAATSAEPSRVEINLFRLINQLPDAAGPPLIGVMQFGALAAVPVVAIVCVLARRLRLARLVALGGAADWCWQRP